MAPATRARQAKAAATEAETEAAALIEELRTLCVLCHQQTARATLQCSECKLFFHLGCLVPAMRRRPPQPEQWKCHACVAMTDIAEFKQRVKSAVAKRSRIGARSSEDSNGDSAGSHRNVRKARKAPRRGSRTRDQQVSDEEEEEEKASVKEEDAATSGRGRSAGGKPTTRKRGASNGAATTPRTSPVRRTRARVAKSVSRKSARAKSKVKAEDTSSVSGDDDKDSDFEAPSASGSEEEDEEDEEDEESSASEDTASKKRRQQPRDRKKTSASRQSNGARSATNRTRNNATADAAAAADETAQIAPDVPPEVTEEEYDGPTYRVEYSPNARAKCKSCDVKLQRDELRVAVRAYNSMFGLTTYFKHLHCTQLCDLRPPNSETPTSDDKNAEDPVLAGFATLSSEDQSLIRKTMAENRARGLEDERWPLTEEQYHRKARMPEIEPSPYITATLLPYQREALGWMVAQEQNSYRGGILADEMGMGKTLQAIALIVQEARCSSPQVRNGKARAKPASKHPVGGTLVVCPVVAVMQWKSEIERFVEPNKFSIYVHHGTQREVDAIDKIAQYDIVLTTYSVLESESRKSLGWEKVPCPYCQRKYLPDKLIVHNKYFCGPNARKTAKQSKQQTKTKKKAAGEESDDDEQDNSSWRRIFGQKRRQNRQTSDSEEEKQDPKVAAALKRARVAKKGRSPLHEVYWTRVVLDEAHYIKDRRCNTARGVFALESQYKWCLTGTPLQNRIGELFSLVRFLQVPTFAYYHCNKCTCQMLEFEFKDGKCTRCMHRPMDHFSFFNKKIAIPIQGFGYVAEGKIAMLRLQNDVLQHVLLRRTKEARADDLRLPPKLIRIRRDRLDERENDFYQAIYTQSQAQFNTYVASGTLLNNYAHIFDLLVRLRQAVDHPYLVIYSKSNPALQAPTEARPLVEQKPLVATVSASSEDIPKSEICPLCHEEIEDCVVAACKHAFCRGCIQEFLGSLPDGAVATCPVCDEPLTVELGVSSAPTDALSPTNGSNLDKTHKPQLTRFHKNSILHRVADIASYQSSTKIEALMQELAHMKIRDPSGKAIVFSQFVNMLDLIEHRLTLGGISCVKLSGSMTMDARDRMIRAFRDDTSVTVFLISLKAGGVALNLTVASHIFLMDPWWNPAAEQQAIDRTHRLGQYKPVQATRFIIAGTIEERILQLQEKKRLIFEGTVGASVSAICRLTEEDLRFLFAQ